MQQRIEIQTLEKGLAIQTKMAQNREDIQEETIVQWNCQGMFAKREQIEKLIYDVKPKCICLQETMKGNRKPFKVSRYKFICQKTRVTNEKKGGTAILVRDDVSHKEVMLNTTLEATAIKININKQMITVCNVYLSPSESINYENLNNLVSQLKQPFIIMGDFNAYSLQWGNRPANNRGKILEDRDLYLLNEQQNTHLHTQTDSESAIDLAMCSRQLLTELNWEVMNDLYTSDHFPIRITTNKQDFDDQVER